MSELEKLCERAIEKWGIEAQLDMAIEECSELIKEICKLRRKQSDWSRVSEEAVDVYLLMNQLRTIHSAYYFDYHLSRKMRYLKDKLGEENEF